MIKTLAKILAGLVLLFVIAVGVFLYTFDANNYKQEITELAGVMTGRTISIAGDMDISVYPWIGIKVNDVTVGNSAGFSNPVFATIGQLDVSVKIMPLLSRHLDVDKLVLHRLAVNFEKNAAGENNWSDFSEVSDSSEVESRFGLAGLAVGRIDLKEASMTWLNTNTGKQFKISKMSLGTRAVSKGQPLPIELKALVESSQPEWMAAVNAKTTLEFSQDSAVFDAKGLKLSVKALLPDTEMGKLTVAMVSDGTVDLQTQSAKLTNTKVGLLGVVMAGTFDVEHLFSVPVIQGPVKVKTFEAAKVAEHLKLEMPQLNNPQSLKKIKLTGNFKTDFNSVKLDDISALVDQSKVTGFVHVAGLSRPVIRYQLEADQLNLDDYLPAAAAADQDETLLPLDFIRAAALDGVLDIEALGVGGVEATGFQVTSNIESGIVNANPVTMQLHDGEVSAALRLDASETPVLSVTAEVREVDADGSLNPLLQNMIGDQAPVFSGRVDADINLSARGFSLPALQRSAKGSVKFEMGSGTIKGVDFNHASQSVVVDYAERNDFRVSRTFNEEYVPDSITEFKSLKANFRISKGRLVNDDLLMVSDTVDVTGSGAIDFVNAKLDYRPEIDMHVGNTGNIRDKLRDHPMMYHAHGAFGEVRVDFDVARYDLHLGRLMIQEAKAHRNRRINSEKQHSWHNAVSK